ncbi:hypothetical protein ACJX0J_017055, partial [Zea mays]
VCYNLHPFKGFYDGCYILIFCILLLGEKVVVLNSEIRHDIRGKYAIFAVFLQGQLQLGGRYGHFRQGYA